MPDLTIPVPPRLAFPIMRVTRTAHDIPREIGRWLEQKCANGDFERLPLAELRDLRTAALLLEGVGERRKWWRFEL